MSLQVITNILNDYLSLEQEGKELLLQLLLETEDEDVECSSCTCCFEEQGSLPTKEESGIEVVDLNSLWKEYVQSANSANGLARF